MDGGAKNTASMTVITPAQIKNHKIIYGLRIINICFFGNMPAHYPSTHAPTCRVLSSMAIPSFFAFA
jgi:hypothetical protein